MINSFVTTQAACLILPLDHIFQEADRVANKQQLQRQPSSSPDSIRQILAFYMAQLFSRLLIYALNDEDNQQ